MLHSINHYILSFSESKPKKAASKIPKLTEKGSSRESSISPQMKRTDSNRSDGRGNRSRLPQPSNRSKGALSAPSTGRDTSRLSDGDDWDDVDDESLIPTPKGKAGKVTNNNNSGEDSWGEDSSLVKTPKPANPKLSNLNRSTNAGGLTGRKDDDEDDDDEDSKWDDSEPPTPTSAKGAASQRKGSAKKSSQGGKTNTDLDETWDDNESSGLPTPKTKTGPSLKAALLKTPREDEEDEEEESSWGDDESLPLASARGQGQGRAAKGQESESTWSDNESPRRSHTHVKTGEKKKQNVPVDDDEEVRSIVF